jgi:acyl-CoA synthetase (NDP forming)
MTSLEPFLRPRSVAVVGASTRTPLNVGGRAAAVLRKHSEIDVFVVSTSAPPGGADGAYPSLSALPAPPDLVVVAVPAPAAVAVVEEAAAVGARAALVFSAGFAEVGDDGAAAQARLSEIARETGLLISGPNTIGYLNAHDGIHATFFLQPDEPAPQPGPVALVSQSGGFAAYIDELARDAGVDLGWLVATGNEVDLTVTDVLAYLVERPEVTVLAGFSEAIRKPDQFVDVAVRAAELGKPFVFLKAGGSEAGQGAAMSHTASIAGSDQAFDAVCTQYGVQRADSLEQMLDWLKVLQTGRSLSGDRVALLTGSGGSGVLMADAAEEAGLVVAPTPAADRGRIEALIPSFGSAANPIDVTAQAVASGVGSYGEVLSTLLASDGFDAVAIGSGLRGASALHIADAVAAAYTASDKPLTLAFYSTNEQARRILVGGGVPTYADSARSLGALGALRRHRDRPPVTAPSPAPVDAGRAARGRELLASAAGRRTLTEFDSALLLELYGLPVSRQRLAASADQAAEVAAELRFPVAVKVVSMELPHKSDVGGVVLGVQDATGVADAGRQILEAVAANAPTAAVEGLLVQEMAPHGIELLCGLHRDPLFGAMVTVGIGGVLTEIHADVALRRCPVSEADALGAIRSLSGGRLTTSSRGLGVDQLAPLGAVLTGLSALAAELPEVAEIDLNPVIVSAAGPRIADALVVLSPAP